VKVSTNSSMYSGRIENPAAARWPPKRSSISAQTTTPPCRSKAGIERPDPLQSPSRAGDEHHRAREALDQTRGDDSDHALMPVLAVRARRRAGGVSTRARIRPLHRLAQDPVLNGLALAVQLLELQRA
jgi:hypothetical protein